MKNKPYKIDFEIYIVFIAVIGISVFNAIYSSLNISRNEEITSRIMTVDIPSLQKLENMNLLITRSKMYTTNWVYLSNNKDDKERLRALQMFEYPELKSSIINLMKEWKDDQEISNMKKVFSGFEDQMVYQNRIMKSLKSFDDYEDPEKRFGAEEIIDKNILPNCASLTAQLNNIINKKRVKAELKHIEMLSSSRSLMWSVMGIAILIVLVILIAAAYMSNNIIVPTMKLKNFVLQMGKGEIPDINIKAEKNAIGQMIVAVQSLTASLKKTAHFAHEIGYGNFSAEYEPSGDKDELGNALVQMRFSLRKADEENKHRSWTSSVIEKINKVLRENTDDIDKLSDSVVSVLVKSVNAIQGGIYLIEERHGKEDPCIRLQGTYAMQGRVNAKQSFALGEGLVGQVVKNKELIYLNNIKNTERPIESGLSTYFPSHILIIPLKYHDRVFGAIELSSFTEFREFEINFIRSIGETIGSTIASVTSNTLTKRLLSETRKQAARLSSQEEELRRANSELSNQSKLLQESEEELKISNLELKKKARELQQKNEINDQARQALIIKAKELELNSKYKSEFLANMSHELRTPLNSVLILAKLLEENSKNNLSPKQIEYAGVIYKSGKDLLHLINDILDLSKIEAGKIELVPEETDINSVSNDMRLLFDEVANEKKIKFEIDHQQTIPEKFISDKVRLEQIIKNLLSNAFKFTPAEGQIIFRIKRPEKNVSFSNPNLFNKDNIIEFSVTDSGIGIPLEKQALIFEAFQQADGSTNRSYGGTGLGLSISKMLVSLLGGEMQLISEQGKGSTFYVYLPVDYLNGKETASNNVPDQQNFVVQEGKSHLIEEINPFVSIDDRSSLTADDKILLIVEDDLKFANAILEVAHEKNFKAIIANDGNDVLKYAEEYHPSAIILDTQLPGMNGWTVLNKLKSDTKLNHIPVHLVSAMNCKQLGIDMGASNFLRKPLDKIDLDSAFESIDNSIENDINHVLLIEDVHIHQEIVKNLLKSYHHKVEVNSVSTIEDALEYLLVKKADCIILDLDLGNGIQDGLGFLYKIRSDERYSQLPVIVFTGAEIDDETEKNIRNHSATIVNKNSGSFDKLISETEIFLHKINEGADNFTIVPQYMADILRDKKVLIIDDDMRNVFALSNTLEQQEMKVVAACNGRLAIEKLKENKDVDIILMDVMKPEVDGCETIKAIRAIENFRNTPIISLTSWAMAGDRERSLQCGASDYISKPVNTEQLFSLMRVWLFKESQV